jgi:hypothetical protein
MLEPNSQQMPLQAHSQLVTRAFVEVPTPPAMTASTEAHQLDRQMPAVASSSLHRMLAFARTASSNALSPQVQFGSGPHSFLAAQDRVMITSCPTISYKFIQRSQQYQSKPRNHKQQKPQ